MKTSKSRMAIMGAILLLALTAGLLPTTQAQFVHPGCLGSQADLNRAKTEVAASVSPWIDSWNRLLANSHAQLTYVDHPQSVVYRGVSGSCPSENYTYLYNDAAAIWACALRYQISGDTNYANKAVQIMNDWSSTLTGISTCVSDGYLASGIYGYEMACGAELMRNYSGWAPADFARYQAMMTNIFYPLNHDFLLNHNGACISHYWANWDLCNMASMLAIGVLCDNTNIYNEAINYFYTGAGNGSISHAVVDVFPDTQGQWQESGRDQGHCMLGVGLLGAFCEIAWNQGLDLYGDWGNRFLEGAEYVAKYNLTNTVPYLTYNNCDNVNQTVISSSGRGILAGGNGGRPIWELLYNHYVRIKGMNEPYLAEAAQIVRPEGGGGDYGPNSGGYDHLGYGTLLFSQTSGAPGAPPAAPTGLTATAPSSCQINLSWTASSGATSYNVYRSTVDGGPYTLVTLGVAGTSYSDTGVTPSTAYYYVVGAVSSAGESAPSTQAGVTTPAGGSLPAGWSNTDIGSVGAAGSSIYNCGTFTVSGAGSDIGGTGDSLQYAYENMTGDGTIIARLAAETMGGSVNDKVGLMMRETTSSGSIMAAVLLDSALGGSRFVYRSSTGGSATWVNGPAGTTLPLWYKLVRSGNTLTGYVSSDGVAWTTIGSATATMASGITVGLAVCSRDTTALNTSTFDNVTAPGGSSPPAAPTGLSATGGNLVVDLNWTQSTSPGITGNNVYRSTTGSGGPYNLLANLAATISYSDATVAAGNTYFYTVTAVNGNGESALSAYAGATTVPPTPAGLSAAAGNNQVALSWSASSGATSYNVKRATVSGGPYTTLTNITATSYTDTAVANGTTYYYVVSALNSSGESANSSQVSATPSAPSAPNAPTGLTATAQRQAGKIKLTWTQSTSSNIATNNVYRSTVGGGPYTKIASLAATTSYLNNGLASGTTYYYVVTALNSGGLESPYSNQGMATAK